MVLSSKENPELKQIARLLSSRRARRAGLVNCPGQRQWKENTRVSGTSPGLVNPKGTAFPSLTAARYC